MARVGTQITREVTRKQFDPPPPPVRKLDLGDSGWSTLSRRLSLLAAARSSSVSEKYDWGQDGADWYEWSQDDADWHDWGQDDADWYADTSHDDYDLYQDDAEQWHDDYDWYQDDAEQWHRTSSLKEEPQQSKREAEASRRQAEKSKSDARASRRQADRSTLQGESRFARDQEASDQKWRALAVESGLCTWFD